VRRHAALAVSAAWHAEAFARTERLPELAPLLEQVARGPTMERSPATAEEQTPEEQLDVMRAIAASFKKGAE